MKKVFFFLIVPFPFVERGTRELYLGSLLYRMLLFLCSLRRHSLLLIVVFLLPFCTRFSAPLVFFAGFCRNSLHSILVVSLFVLFLLCNSKRLIFVLPFFIIVVVIVVFLVIRLHGPRSNGSGLSSSIGGKPPCGPTSWLFSSLEGVDRLILCVDSVEDEDALLEEHGVEVIGVNVGEE